MSESQFKTILEELRTVARVDPARCNLGPPLTDFSFVGDLAESGLLLPSEVIAFYTRHGSLALTTADGARVFGLLSGAGVGVAEKKGTYPDRVRLFRGGTAEESLCVYRDAAGTWWLTLEDDSRPLARKPFDFAAVLRFALEGVNAPGPAGDGGWKAFFPSTAPVVPKDNLLHLDAFTRGAKDAVIRAQALADGRKHERITSAHIVAALLEVGEVPAFLERVGVAVAPLRERAAQILADLPQSTEPPYLEGSLLETLKRAPATAAELGVEKVDYAALLVGLGIVTKNLEPGPPWQERRPDFLYLDRFTKDAKTAVGRAQALADEAKHASLVPAHLVLALLDVPEAARLLEEHGASLAALREQANGALAVLPKSENPAYLDAVLLSLLKEGTGTVDIRTLLGGLGLLAAPARRSANGRFRA